MASLCDSKTNVYAKCRIKLEFNVEREKKHESVLVILSVIVA